MDRHNETVRSQFQKQAAHFSSQDSNQAKRTYLDWILDSLSLDRGYTVLDVAAGTGILSRALAPRVNHVTAIDLSADMLLQGQIETAAAGIGNVVFVEGAVETLPFDDAHFDLVVCRFAFHHFVEPMRVLREMARVCRRGQSVAVIDIVSPDDRDLADAYNRYETLRDPSHARALRRSDYSALFLQAGLTVTGEESIDVEVDLAKWLALTKPDQAVADQITQDAVHDIRGGKATGLRPFYRDGRLFFHHTYMKMIGSRTAG